MIAALIVFLSMLLGFISPKNWMMNFSIIAIVAACLVAGHAVASWITGSSFGILTLLLTMPIFAAIYFNVFCGTLVLREALHPMLFGRTSR
jgi:hypothetical protein